MKKDVKFVAIFQIIALNVLVLLKIKIFQKIVGFVTLPNILILHRSYVNKVNILKILNDILKKI